MNTLHIKKLYDAIQALIAEYESKYDKPTLEGFSTYLVRQSALAIKIYEIQRDEMTKRRNE